MPDRKFDLLIDIQSKVSAIDDAVRKIQNLNAETKGLSSAFEGVLKGIQLGLGIDLVGVVSEIPAKLREAVEEGVRFNAFLESAQIGVAGMLRQFEPDRYKSFQTALSDSGVLIDLLRSKANQLGLSFEAFVEQYRTTAGALFAGGVTDLQKQVDLTVLLNQAVGALGITGFQAQRDIFDLLEGRASRTIAGKALAISDEDVQRASQAGQLYEFLTTKFQALSESGQILGTTFQASEQRAKNLAEQLAGIATKDFFGDLKRGLDSFNQSLAGPQTAEAVAGVANVIRGTFSGLGDIISGVNAAMQKVFYTSQQFYALLSQLGGAATQNAGPGIFDVGAARQFLVEAEKIRTSVLDTVLAAKTENEQKQARQALDAAIVAAQDRVKNSTSQTHDFAEQLLHDLETMRSVFPDIVGQSANVTHNLEAAGEAAEKVASALAKIDGANLLARVQLQGNDELAATIKASTAFAEARDAALKAGANPEQADVRGNDARQLVLDTYRHEVDLKKQSLSLTDQENSALHLKATGQQQAGDAAQRNVEIQRLTLQYQKDFNLSEEDARSKATQRVNDEAAISQQKRDQKSSTEGERDARREITNLLREDSALLKGLQSEQRLIQQNPNLGPDEKQSLLHDNAVQQQTELQAAIGQTQEALQKAYGAGSQDEIVKLGERLGDLKTRSVELGYTIQTTTFTGGLRAELVQWVNSIGTASHAVAQVITGTLNTALSATSQALTNLIFHTGNWKQTFAQAAQAIVGNVIQIVLQYTIGRAVMFAINKAFGGAETTASNKAAESATTAWSPAAIAASIASYGAASGVGLAAFLAAEVAGTAAAGALSGVGGAAGYASGGYTGDGDIGDVAGFVHGREFVFSAKATENFGLERLNNLHAIGVQGGFAAGGFVGGGGGNGAGPLGALGDTHVFVLFDEKEIQRRVLESDAAIKKIVRVVNGAGGSLRS